VTLDLLALVPYPLDTTPSQRFRLEQWAPLLARDHGIRLHFAPFADPALGALLSRPGRVAQKAAGMARATAARLPAVLRARRYDAVVVHRAVCLAGPAVLERVLAAGGPPLLFDFDDAIWLRHTSGANALFDRLKFPGKTATLCRLADRVVVGSEYLADWARAHSARVDVVPTSIDTAAYEVRDRSPGARVVVGWTGSATSMTHLEAAAPLLRRLAAARPVEIRVLSTRTPVLPDVPVVFRHWTPENEVEEIRAFDVGIKPMPDDEWARGKCPMKELQYLALRVPAVVSAVGGSREAVRHGDNGFLVSSEDEWMDALLRLVDDPALRARLGDAGRRTVLERYASPRSAAGFAASVRAAVERR
jgi:glycosyltransferase involved in cell wall biosynthesis